MNKFKLPLMDDNITKEDVQSLVDFLSQEKLPKLTNGPKVLEFENRWSEWLGMKYSLMLNSGASANELTLLALNYIYGEGEIIVPPLTWISDISAVLFSGMKPIFCDINLKNLSFNIDKLKELITPNTKAIFLTHVLGINGLTDELIEICEKNNIILIEDVCESHGTTFKDKKVGSFGFVSNFSFYFAHHMSTIEGGMICTNDEYFYQVCRALRSHGMVREMTDDNLKEKIISENPELNSDFIFLRPSHNFRSTEINAVLGLSQIGRLDSNNEIRKSNFNHFISKLDSNKYITDLDTEGQCNYAFIIILKEGTFEKRNQVELELAKNGIEFRRGLSGGGNQLRQPFIKENFDINYDDFKTIDYVHNFSWYVGNYPTLTTSKIDKLLEVLNNI
jgi:CDP-6-deoxy-D-xylo-4-hexulose-3-dehydrase